MINLLLESLLTMALLIWGVFPDREISITAVSVSSEPAWAKVIDENCYIYINEMYKNYSYPQNIEENNLLLYLIGHEIGHCINKVHNNTRSIMNDWWYGWSYLDLYEKPNKLTVIGLTKN